MIEYVVYYIMPDFLTPGASVLAKELKDGTSLIAASSIAFPEREDSYEYSLAMIKDNVAMRAIVSTIADSKGLTDEYLFEALKESVDTPADDPKLAPTRLQAIKEAFKLKGRYKEPNEALTINNTQNNTVVNMEVAREQAMAALLEEIRQELPDEELYAIIEKSKTVVDVELIPREELFEK